MSASSIKGGLLEYFIRNLLVNCGFKSVIPDGTLIYSRGNLTMINGRGAAHDADVLMTPPIQMPFTYPYRVNFECKAYKNPVGLPIVRNALGFRYDVNGFEIVTYPQIQARQNQSRTIPAIDRRQRFNYQIGVASVERFTNSAFEFAANNKIPLISLRWFIDDVICDKFHLITKQYLEQFRKDELDDLERFLKSNNNSSNGVTLLQTNNYFSDIYNALKDFERNIFVGLLESGDMVFLISKNVHSADFIKNRNNTYKAQFHYWTNNRELWTLSIENLEGDDFKYEFYLPHDILEEWKEENYSQQTAIGIKGEFFSSMVVFVKGGTFPFKIIYLDKDWHESISE